MKTTSLFLGGAVGLSMLLASCSQPLDTSRVPMSAAPTAQQSGLVGELDSSINAYRQSIGKAPIARNPGLDKMAAQHCQFMARNRGKFSLSSKNISHHGFEGRALYAQHQYGMESVAENLAGGVIKGDIPKQLVNSWVASKGHVYNLKQDWDATGIGVYVAEDGMVYATQIFATKRNSQMQMVDRFRQF